MPDALPILRVAVPAPLHRLFDYLPPSGELWSLPPGVRLQIPFGRAQAVGVLMEVAWTSELALGKLKPILGVLDTVPVLPQQAMALAQWVSAYYHYPIGEVIDNMLPPSLRRGQAAQLQLQQLWRLTETGTQLHADTLARAPRQVELLLLMQRSGGSLVPGLSKQWYSTFKALAAKGLAEIVEAMPATVQAPQVMVDMPTLNAAQQVAVSQITASLSEYKTFLLDGVTGSGKTEVYLRAIEPVIRAGGQALVLVPEIGLTPQLIARFRDRFPVPLAILHSALSDKERLQAWLMAREGLAPIVLGTRSSIFTPLRNPGIFIVDEEHDLSFKQQEGLRYSARDIAVVRAMRAKVPVVLGSATPSLESIHNVNIQRYQHISLPQRAGGAAPPTLGVVDMRKQPVQNGLSAALLHSMRKHLDAKGQVLLFLNRRGYAPILVCHGCGWIAECRQCDARMTVHWAKQSLVCHHCSAQRRIDAQCPKCKENELRPLGQGTERVEEYLQQVLGQTPIVRIDRDSTRRKGSMQRIIDDIHKGEPRVLVGTQMLAKGHHFPHVTLVGIINADQGLFGVDFRASERMAQLITQVSGRAGRAERPGQVLIQTYQPEHPLLRLLLKEGYAKFAQAMLLEREQAALPPYASLALLRAEANDVESCMVFLNQAKGLSAGLGTDGVDILGPVPALMTRRAGRFRAQLLVSAVLRKDLHRLLSVWIPALQTLKAPKKLRWSLDVDAMETV